MKAAAEKKQASAAAKVAASAATTAGKSFAGVNTGEDEDDDDEEEGRVSMVGMKNKKRRRVDGQGRATPAASNINGDDAVEEGGDNGTVKTEEPVSVKQAPSKGRKKATSYLDELLAERSKKRKKR